VIERVGGEALGERVKERGRTRERRGEEEERERERERHRKGEGEKERHIFFSRFLCCDIMSVLFCFQISCARDGRD